MKAAVPIIEELARQVAEKAAHTDTKFSDKMEALRVLTPYYAKMTRSGTVSVAAAPEGLTIGGLQDAVRQAEGSNGKRAVPSHKRRGGAQAALND